MQIDTTYSIPAEEGVLGAILVDNSVLGILDLPIEAFYTQEHRDIYSAMLFLSVSGCSVDVISLTDIIKNKLPGIKSYLDKLIATASSNESLISHVNLIKEKHTKRNIIGLCNRISDMAGSGSSSQELLSAIYGQISDIDTQKTSQEPKLLSEIVNSYNKTMDDRLSGRVRPVATGHKYLDKVLNGGFDRGTLVIIAARPGMGKTALALSIARNASSSGTVLFLSMEMVVSQIIDRNISALGHVSLNFLKKPAKDHSNWGRIEEAKEKCQSLKLLIDDQPALSLFKIGDKAKKTKMKYGLDLLVIDQLSMIAGGSKDKSYENVGEYTRSLVRIAKELDIPVVLICQLNRECEKRVDKRPMLSDLATSGNIEQDADTVLMLYRDEVYNKNSDLIGKAEVSVVKQRQGGTGMVYLSYIGDQTRFEDITTYD